MWSLGEKENRKKSKAEGKMAKNFPNTMKAINPKIQETQYIPRTK